jgi:hypothetical protein
MLCVQFVLVLGTLAADAPCPLERPHAQLHLPLLRRLGQHALDAEQQPPQHCALAFERMLQTLGLLRVRVAAGTVTQTLALAFVGLLQVQSSDICLQEFWRSSGNPLPRLPSTNSKSRLLPLTDLDGRLALRVHGVRISSH